MEKIALLRTIFSKIERIEALLEEITKTPDGDRPYVPNEYSMRVPSSWWRAMCDGVPVQPKPEYAVYERTGPPKPKAEE
jgi:hypothetical protein